MGPLNGIKILDFSQGDMTGVFSTRLLADLGAEVIKLEIPGTGGDATRYMTPSVNRNSIYFAGPNRGKKSMLMDLSNAEQLELFHRMVADADAVLENFPNGAPEKLECSYEKLKEYNPKIVCTSITGFGLTGPWKDYPSGDITAQASSGLMSLVGEYGGTPQRVGWPFGEMVPGFYGSIGTLIALYAAQKTGIGRQADISMRDATMSTMGQPITAYMYTGKAQIPFGNKHPNCVPVGGFNCKDGKDIFINIARDDNFAAFCGALGAPELIEDPRFTRTYSRIENREVVEKTIAELFRKFDSQELNVRFLEANVPFSFVYNVKEITETDHMADHNMTAQAYCPDGTVIKCTNTPFNISGMERPEQLPVPALGEHTIEIAQHYLGADAAHALYDAEIAKAKTEAKCRSAHMA